jgi:hypothetical protein
LVMAITRVPINAAACDEVTVAACQADAEVT